MLYVKRDETGKMEDFSFVPKPGYELTSLEDPAVVAWLQDQENRQAIDETLRRMDLEMARVVEDLIEMMIEKGLILFTDLPEAVQNKILFKRRVRNLRESALLHNEDEDLLF